MIMILHAFLRFGRLPRTVARLAVMLLPIVFSVPGAAQPSGRVINIYTPVEEIGVCWIRVASSVGFAPGDRTVMIQMQGAKFRAPESEEFGGVSDDGKAGRFEFGTISHIDGNVIYYDRHITRSYNISGKVQLVRVPRHEDYTIGEQLTCKPWDGTVGGVFALEVIDTLNFTGSGRIDVTGTGFRGGKKIDVSRGCGPGNLQYVYPAGSDYAARKGEGIAIYSDPYANGKGCVANAGGGGNNHNAGGGGGGNGGEGGFGGCEWSSCSNRTLATRGIGGVGLPFYNLPDDIRAFLGGGGGAGHTNNRTGTSGGNGGGLVFISAGTMLSRDGAAIIADGDSVPTTVGDGQDGCGGGGAGGGVYIVVRRFLDRFLRVSANGGNGGNTTFYEKVGPGGGGGGGVLWVSLPPVQAGLIMTANPGINGQHIRNDNDAWEAERGGPGLILTDLVLPEGTLVPISSAITLDGPVDVCSDDSLTLTVAPGFSAYRWSTGSTERSIRVGISGTYSVFVTDAAGCVGYDSVSIIYSLGPVLDAGTDISVCDGASARLQAFCAGGSPPYTYSWSPPDGLSSTTIPDPYASPDAVTTYTLIVVDVGGCADTATVTVTPVPTTFSITSTLAAGALDLGTVDLRGSRCDALRVFNSGDDPLVIDGAGLAANIIFSIPPDQLPLTVPPHGEGLLRICYDPEGIGSDTDTLFLNTDCLYIVPLAAESFWPDISASDLCGTELGIGPPDTTRALVKISPPYPNPGSGKLAIPIEWSASPSIPFDGRCVVQDLLGNVVAEGRYASTAEEVRNAVSHRRGTFTVDLDPVPPGTYVVTAAAGDVVKGYSIVVVR